MDDLGALLQRFWSGDRRALARLLTLAELGLAPAPCGPRSGRIIGITGSAGSGKSTLVASLVEHLRKRNLRVAVVACDPRSPKTGGALLGDRIRVRFDPADEGVYFRSLSTRGAQGGISDRTGELLHWLQAFGFDVILVETVGIGQDQVAVRSLVQTLVLLVTPGTGDEVQWEKAGVMEVADLIVVNKCDLPGADRVRQQLLAALTLDPQEAPPPVLQTNALSGQGVAELWAAIGARSAAGATGASQG
jgi:LAO/AO transport system kinase